MDSSMFYAILYFVVLPILIFATIKIRDKVKKNKTRHYNSSYHNINTSSVNTAKQGQATVAISAVNQNKDAITDSINIEDIANVCSTCTSCGNELIEGSEFCHKCGTKVEAKKVCIKCKSEVDDDMIFCNICGNKL